MYILIAKVISSLSNKSNSILIIIASITLLIGCKQLNNTITDMETQEKNIQPTETHQTNISELEDSTENIPTFKENSEENNQINNKSIDIVITEENKITSNKDIPNTNWQMNTEVDSVGPEGVSPDAILLPDGRVRLYVTNMGIEIWESYDGLSFQKIEGKTPPGADPTIIQTSTGWRMYFTEFPPGGPDTGQAKISTATSIDGINWTKDDETGIVQEHDRKAWGVPDSFMLPNGQIRIIWTDMVKQKKLEVLRSATSSDGVYFNLDEGLRLSGGFVDSYVLNGLPNYMIVSTTPPGGPIKNPQRLFLANSVNGMDWKTNDYPLLDRSPRNALDPTSVYLGNNTWRIYYTLTDDSNPFEGFKIASAILTGPITPEEEPILVEEKINENQTSSEKIDVHLSDDESDKCTNKQYVYEDIGLALTAKQAGNIDSMAPMANPSSLKLLDGNIRLFFTNAGAGIGSAISSDGISFTYEGIRISAPEAMKQGVNLGPLRVFRLPDERIRLFVGSSQTGVQSFVSNNEGMTFSVEKGERISQEAAKMPAIQKLSIISIGNNNWQGYFGPAPQHGPPPPSGQNLINNNTPGQNNQQPGPPGQKPNIPNEQQQSHGSGPPDHWILRATSTDLFNWTVEKDILIGPGAQYLTASAREVAPLSTNDGCITLFYQLNKPQDAGIRDFSGVAVIGYSSSEDGKTFTKQYVLINERDPAGPDVIQLQDESYLMYHDSTEKNGYGHGIRVGRLYKVDN